MAAHVTPALGIAVPGSLYKRRWGLGFRVNKLPNFIDPNSLLL